MHTRHGDSVVGDAVAAAVVHNDEHRQWLHLIPRCHADSWADGHLKVTPAPQEQQACAARGAESSSRSGAAKIRGNAKRNTMPPRMAWWSLNRDGQQQPGFGCGCRFGINTATQPHTQHCLPAMFCAYLPGCLQCTRLQRLDSRTKLVQLVPASNARGGAQRGQ